MTRTRRLAAILAADVAGYSRLMGQDEEGTHERLQAHLGELVNPKITGHRGRIVKNTGDGFLAEFASVVDAVRCAVEMQRGIAERNACAPPAKRIEFRVGINLGDVIAEADDIFGDGVNIAARLEALAEPGGVLVSNTVYEHVRDRLPFAFEDLGEHQVKNIARPVRVYRVRQHPDGPARKPAPVSPQPLPLPDKPSLAVLPFQNMTGDAEQDYFVDGVVEEITTAISRLRWLFVIARNSAFTYKGRAVDVKEVARDLGVRYVLEGSVRKAASRVRITGQLIDTATGSHIWADRFDGALDDIFELQDQVASSVVGAIEPRLRLFEVERARRKPPDSLDAYDLYLRALPEFHKHSAQGMRESIALLKQALAIDPAYAPAAAMFGFCRGFQRARGWEAVSAADIAEGLSFARQAIEDGNDDPDVLSLAGFTIAYVAGDHATAASIIDRAVTLNPNSAQAWNARGWVSAWRNQPGPAVEAFQRAIRLSPLDPLGYMFLGGLSFAHFVAGRFEEAVEWADRCVRAQPRFSNVLRVKIASLSHLGRIEEARNLLPQLLNLLPKLTIAKCAAFYADMAMPSQITQMHLEGLRKAGLPEE